MGIALLEWLKFLGALLVALATFILAFVDVGG